MKHFNKQLAIQFFFGFFPTQIFAQNVGIDVNPTKAKFEVWGTNDPVNGLGTVAVFGSDGTGISLQRNWPTIGFNQYRDKFNEERRLGAGKASHLYFEPTNGNFGWDVYSNSGTANSLLAGSGVTRAISILNNGNIGLRTLGLSDASLWVAKGNNFSGAAVFSGTNHNSHFAYSDDEDTYIRAGKNGSKVLINDIPNGQILLGNGTAKVGINTNPAATLDIYGTMALRRKDVILTTDYQQVTTDVSNIIFTVNNIQRSGIVLTPGTVIGQILILHLYTNLSCGGIFGIPFYIPDNKAITNINLETSYIMCNNSILTLIWGGDYWYETSRVNNGE